MFNYRTLFRIFNHIDESRNLSKAIFFLSFVTFLIGIVLPFPIFECKITNDKIKCEKYISSLSNGILGVSASLLAASLTDILVGMRDVWIREEKQGKFRIFFGIDKDVSDVAIVVPRFSIQGTLKDDNKLKELEDKLGIKLSDTERMMIRANEGFYSSADLQSSTSLNILFDRVKIPSSNTKNNIQEIVKPRLEYTTEEDKEEHNKELKELNEYNILFVIGLFSNVLLMKNSELNQTDFFTIVFSGNKAFIKIAKEEYNKWQKEVSDDEDYYYGLLARLKVDKKVVFVSGGIKAELTIRCSEFLLENWENIYQKLSHEVSSYPLPTDRNFAICMRMKKEEADRPGTTLNMNDIYCFCIQKPDGEVKFVK